MGPESYIVVCPQCGVKNRISRERWGDKAVCGKCRASLSPAVPFPTWVVDVSDQIVAQEVQNFPGPVLLEFWAPWCPHCRTLAPVLDELASEYAGRVKVVRLNINEQSLTPPQYGVNSVPTMLFFKNGKSLSRLVGSQPKAEIESHLKGIL
jgi:thioredoxin 2